MSFFFIAWRLYEISFEWDNWKFAVVSFAELSMKVSAFFFKAFSNQIRFKSVLTQLFFKTVFNHKISNRFLIFLTLPA